MRLRLLAAVIVLAAVAAALWRLSAPATVGPLPPYQADAANGRVVFDAAGCASCHATPGQDNPGLLGGGLRLPTTFGTFVAPNISPDPDAGIGKWTERQFVDAVMLGTDDEGDNLYPAMPYTSYRLMTLNDVRDLHAYMRTLPWSSHAVGDSTLSFPFNIRRAVGLWKRLYFDDRPFRADPKRTPEWNRGAYLANGAAHCAECHSPRDALGGIIADARFAGGTSPDGKHKVPNITPAGIGDWSLDDLTSALDDGITPDGDVLGGDMADVVKNLALIPASDRRAIAVYIKSLPPHPTVH
jgi:mono/diheme cytochrome c family protein